MPVLAPSAVTVNDSWTEGGTNGRRRVVKMVTVVLASQGGATNNIPASALGLRKIEESSPAVIADDSLVFLTSPSYDGTKLFVYNIEVTTDADRASPVDITGTVRLTVKGYD